MTPHMNDGDLVIVVQKDRFGEFMTWEQGKQADVTKFKEYGDVIIYKFNGITDIHPNIGRAIQYVGNEPVTEIKGFKLVGNYSPPHPGYITWGDNNPRPDQDLNFPSIGIIEPIKDEWIVGKALFTIPRVGYFLQHIIELIVFIVVIMILVEFHNHNRGKKRE